MGIEYMGNINGDLVFNKWIIVVVLVNYIDVGLIVVGFVGLLLWVSYLKFFDM